MLKASLPYLLLIFLCLQMYLGALVSPSSKNWLQNKFEITQEFLTKPVKTQIGKNSQVWK
jgi:hypothetical protein